MLVGQRRDSNVGKFVLDGIGDRIHSSQQGSHRRPFLRNNCCIRWARAPSGSKRVVVRDGNDLCAVLCSYGRLTKEQFYTLNQKFDQRGVSPAKLPSSWHCGSRVTAKPLRMRSVHKPWRNKIECSMTEPRRRLITTSDAIWHVSPNSSETPQKSTVGQNAKPLPVAQEIQRAPSIVPSWVPVSVAIDPSTLCPLWELRCSEIVVCTVLKPWYVTSREHWWHRGVHWENGLLWVQEAHTDQFQQLGDCVQCASWGTDTSSCKRTRCTCALACHRSRTAAKDETFQPQAVKLVDWHSTKCVCSHWPYCQ